MKFTVYVKNWARGGKGGDPALLNKNTKKLCCLGFAALQCGFTEREIRGQSLPSDVAFVTNEPAQKKARGVLIARDNFNTQFSRDAAEINDNKLIDDKTRMQKLRALALKYGHRFVFSSK
jgi:hypothetical protein